MAPKVDAISEARKLLKSTRRKVMAELRKIFASHMWDSGYRIGSIGNSRPMKLWAPWDAQNEPAVVEFDGQALTEFWGFSENGIITDVYCGGCVTQSLSSFSLEDLLMLHKWAVKHVRAHPSGIQN